MDPPLSDDDDDNESSSSYSEYSSLNNSANVANLKLQGEERQPEDEGKRDEANVEGNKADEGHIVKTKPRENIDEGEEEVQEPKLEAEAEEETDSKHMSPKLTLNDNSSKEADLNSERDDIKFKVPLSTSIMLTRLDANTNDIVERIAKPRTDKVTIRFQPIGSAPQMKPKIFKISASQHFQTLIKFLDKKLTKKITDVNAKSINPFTGGRIFCYIHNSFSPGPDEIIGNLFDNFASNNELVVSYCDTVAFR
ncbi:hypothetical protein PACTADRAFT_82823 [Pachysolen tannophilus NRRL Y-2460]|uniref:Ubiquitin-like protein ATG12 n=1 Tax=Pachysolen tannophilus NRRL Y-2460 TaxID=669874 RepID=A0A1E4TP21_PACTA|nr:hypothetical protein PACTADRAFT_82823 [Pachysolen tannophilus NRRL Y-2460]